MSTKKVSGYTLIEILIVISVMSILFGVGYVGFRSFARREAVESFARKIKGDLSIARQKAVSGEKPEGISCNSPNRLTGYNFRLTSNSNYVIEAVCSGGAIEVKNVDLPLDLSMAIPSPNPIFFKVLSKGTNISSTEIYLSLTQEETGIVRKIYVTKVGEIK